MLSTSNITIIPLPWSHPDSIQLRAAQRIEVDAIGGGEAGTPPSAADIPIFLVAYYAGVAVGCGGLRALSASDRTPNNAAEIKRMFVDAAYRGPMEETDGVCTSIAQVILARLEQEGLKQGWSVLLLETGRPMTKARRFYERCGYSLRDVFGGYSEAEDSVYYEKRLHPV